MKTHKKIEQLVQDKIQSLNNKKNKNEMEKNDLEKYSALYRLITNPYEDFFEKITIDIAIAILKDLGIPNEDLMITYKKLIEENLDKKYILYDTDIEDIER